MEITHNWLAFEVGARRLGERWVGKPFVEIADGS